MKILKILSAILFSVFLLFLLRNLLLHFTYNHYSDQKEIVFKSVDDDSEIKKWRFELETHYNGIDELHITEYILSTDSTGIATYRRFKEKIFGVESSRLYSWGSLLPYDKEEYIDSDSTEIKVDESSILHLKSLPFYDGSFIANYKMENENLVISSYIEVNDPKDYENSIPENQSQVIPIKRLIPFFSWLYLRIKQGPLPSPV